MLCQQLRKEGWKRSRTGVLNGEKGDWRDEIGKIYWGNPLGQTLGKIRG